MSSERVKTPCIGVCSTAIGDDVCRGCKRFGFEVIHWVAFSEAEKRAVDDRLERLLDTVVSDKLRVTDPALLEWQLQVQQIACPAYKCQSWRVFQLLRAGAAQIKDPEVYGFQLRDAYRELPLTELRDRIDREFLQLSQAHYERYIRQPQRRMSAPGISGE